MCDESPSVSDRFLDPALKGLPERNLNEGGFLAAGADVEAAFRSRFPRTPRVWLAVWDTYQHRAFAQQMFDGSYDSMHGEREEYSAMKARLAPVTALQALEADARLSSALKAKRGELIRNAREGGASWSDIAEKTGMSEHAAQQECAESGEEH